MVLGRGGGIMDWRNCVELSLSWPLIVVPALDFGRLV